MNNSGWRKQWRKVWDNPLLTSSGNIFMIWMFILDHAVWEPKRVRFNSQTITLVPGQLTVGSSQIAKITHIPSSTVRRILKLLKSEQLIDQRSDYQCSLITVINWNQYQSDEQRNEQRVSSERAASEQRVSTKEEYKNTKNKIISNEIILKDGGEARATREPSPTVQNKNIEQSDPVESLSDRFLRSFRSALGLHYALDGSERNNRKYAQLCVEKYVDLVTAANPDFSSAEIIERAFEIIEYTLEKAAKNKRWRSRITNTQNFYQDSFQIFNPQSL